MGKIITNKIETIIAPGTKVASDVTSKKINLKNYQSAKIVVSSSTGANADATATIIAIDNEDHEVEIKQVNLRIGGERENAIDIVSDEIAHYDAKAIKLKVAGVAESEVTIGAIVVLGNPRYAIESESAVEE